MNRINIAIDGFAGCGKSTLARTLAHSLSYVHVDTGALYRAIAHLSLTASNGVDEKSVLSTLAQKPLLTFDSSTNHMFANGDDIEGAIRSKSVASHVSTVAAMPFVRDYLKEVQQRMFVQKGVVMEGRDIGTVVMPNAELKLFVTASTEVRVSRRLNQLIEQGVSSTREEVELNLKQRDKADAERSVAPLAVASDAIILDNTHLNREEQLKTCLALVAPWVDSGLLPFVKRLG